jgi:nickel/cobalt transporter (NicO) family protein
LVLGGLHALAPGHGKTLMAAYAVGRQGGRREMLLIGGVVALTHTAGILLLATVASTSSAFAPDRTLRWTGIASALIVVAVGVNLLRLRWRGVRASHAPHTGDHSHDHTDHAHDHPHDHHHHNDHDHHGHHHGHDHDHDDHEHRQDVAARSGWSLRRRAAEDPRFVVTSHRHGGVAHSHVLPAVGASVPRRELIAMGLAGGLVPSPSALLVLLAAVALGRVWLGLALVVAYGLGLAMTLVGTGLLLARAGGRIRSWIDARPSGGSAIAIRALPLVSAFAVSGAGLLLLIRSVRSF